ncbi:MAG: Cof-type HAD-IIB family hydrolase [Clostridiales bacterium]|nr:Cof-type HAD-IIB family hydrolase [Clostridiales bacterium]
MIKYFVTDLDSTFLRVDKSIPEENIEAIKEARDADINVIISSGRSNMSLDIFAKNLGLDYEGNYIIAYNGCRIYEAKSKKVLTENLLDGETARAVAGIVCKRVPNTLCYADSKLYTQNITPITKRYAFNSSLILNQVDDLRDVMTGDIQKIIMIGDHNDLYKAYEEVIEKLGKDINAETYFSSVDLFEFAAKGKSKGTAIKELAEILGEPLSAFAAIGDNENDIEMIEAAGFGIAVANAIDGCKEKADYVTELDCDNGGFAEGLRYVIRKR